MADDPLDRLVAMAEQLDEAKAELAAVRKVMDRPIQVTVASSSDQDTTLRKIEVRMTELVGQMMQNRTVMETAQAGQAGREAQQVKILSRVAEALERLIPERPDGGPEADDRFFHDAAGQLWDGRLCKKYGMVWECFDPGDADPLLPGDPCTASHKVWRK